MEKILILFFCVTAIILLKFLLKINIKKAKELEENKELQKITDRFPKNIEIANEMLQMLSNNDVEIEEAKNTKTSLYIAITNKIIIADMKDNYGRIQTIAHECIHSVQEKRILMFNFLISNLNIISFIVASILTIFGIYTNILFHISVLLLISLMQVSIRIYLEVEAMIKSRYLSEQYIDRMNLCTIEEKNILLNEYNVINKMGVPFTIYTILTNVFIRIILLSTLGIIFKY